MKYVCDHKRTIEALQTWAKPHKLVTASFFFWSAGPLMQKSQAGLLQSLLYQVLLASPNLILKYFSSRPAKEPWTRKELFKALEKISHGTNGLLSAKYCFFIDGLDEYGGDDEHDVDYQKIVDLLQSLSKSPRIKIYVSSRSWNVFLLAFEGSCNQIAMEKLTIADMEIYVHDLLAQDKGFKRITASDPQCVELVPQIVERAQGVWLWVFFVVRDLLNDIKGREDFSSLVRRLNELPRELQKYFEEILARIDEFHIRDAATIFLVTVEAPRPLPVLAFKFFSTIRRARLYAIWSRLNPAKYTKTTTNGEFFSTLAVAICSKSLIRAKNLWHHDGINTSLF